MTFSPSTIKGFLFMSLASKSLVKYRYYYVYLMRLILVVTNFKIEHFCQTTLMSLIKFAFIKS